MEHNNLTSAGSGVGAGVQLPGTTGMPGVTESLLEQEAVLAKAKVQKIEDLLSERVQLAKDTEARLAAIAGELKSLGWHRTRAAKEVAAARPNAPGKAK